jgi:hypothetical protein
MILYKKRFDGFLQKNNINELIEFELLNNVELHILNYHLISGLNLKMYPPSCPKSGFRNCFLIIGRQSRCVLRNCADVICRTFGISLRLWNK